MKKSIRNQNHLILGAAGALGYGHVKALLERGAQVTVLVRSAERAHVLFGEHENLDVAVGDRRSTSSREAHHCPNGGHNAENSER